MRIIIQMLIERGNEIGRIPKETVSKEEAIAI
jgi:hypothetical protein